MLTLNTSRPTFFVADMVILVGRYGLFVWPMWLWPIWYRPEQLGAFCTVRYNYRTRSFKRHNLVNIRFIKPPLTTARVA